jgi:hypothetical protein
MARPDRGTRLRKAFAVLFVTFVAAGPFVLGVASAQPIPPPSGFTTNNGFMQVQYDGLFESAGVSQGSMVYADLLELQFINYIGARNMTVTSYQNATADGSPPLWANVTVFVAGRTWTDFSLTLPSTAEPRGTRLCADGGCMFFVHQTPIELVPVALNQGTLDLYMLVVGLEWLGGIILAVILAFATMQRALYAPKPKVILILPHVALAIVLAIAIDFPGLIFLLAGYAFFAYAAFGSIGVYFWAQHLFNKADVALLARLNPRAKHGVDANAMTVALAAGGDGSVSVIDRTWTGWLARTRGWHILVWGPPKPNEEPPTIIALRPFPGQSYRSDAISRKRVEQQLSDETHELIRVHYEELKKITLPNRNAPRLLAFVEADQPWTVGRYVIRWSRLHTYEPTVGKDGETIPAKEPRRKFSLPHFEGNGTATLRIAPWHALDGIVQSIVFVDNANVYRRLAVVHSTESAFAAGYRVDADVNTTSRLLEYTRMEAEERDPLTDEAAEAIAKSYRQAENRRSADDDEQDKTAAALDKVSEQLKRTAKK